MAPTITRHLTGHLARRGITRERAMTARLRAERIAVACIGGRRATRGRILTYHSVGTPEWGVHDVSPARFRQHLEIALGAGYRFVPAELLAADLGLERRLALTFDDGLVSVLTNAAPLLSELGIPWTLFIVSDWVDRRSRGDAVMSWREVERAATLGATIGSHSMSHPNFSRLEPASAYEEMCRSREVIASRTGICPSAFAIPFGRSRDWSGEAQEAARRSGYRQVYAQSEELRPEGTTPRTAVMRDDGERIFTAALGGAFDRWEPAF